MAARTRALLALLLATAACADKPAPLPARLEPRALLEEWRSLSERAADVSSPEPVTLYTGSRTWGLCLLKSCAYGTRQGAASVAERGALSRATQAVAQAIEGQFPGSVVRRHAVRDVQVLNAKQQSLELELDGLGHKVLLSDTSPEAFRPLGLETAPRAHAALQARTPVFHGSVPGALRMLPSAHTVMRAIPAAPWASSRACSPTLPASGEHSSRLAPCIILLGLTPCRLCAQEAAAPLAPPGDGGALGDLVLVGPLELVFSSSAAAAPGPEGALPSLPPLLPDGPGAGELPSFTTLLGALDNTLQVPKLCAERDTSVFMGV